MTATNRWQHHHFLTERRFERDSLASLNLFVHWGQFRFILSMGHCIVQRNSIRFLSTRFCNSCFYLYTKKLIAIFKRGKSYSLHQQASFQAHVINRFRKPGYKNPELAPIPHQRLLHCSNNHISNTNRNCSSSSHKTLLRSPRPHLFCWHISLKRVSGRYSSCNR